MEVFRRFEVFCEKQGIGRNGKKAAIGGSGKKVPGEYWSRTCECLARAMEEHYGLKMGLDCYEEDFAYLPKDVFLKEIAPLCERLIEENKERLLLSAPAVLKASADGIEKSEKEFDMENEKAASEEAQNFLFEGDTGKEGNAGNEKEFECLDLGALFDSLESENGNAETAFGYTLRRDAAPDGQFYYDLLEGRTGGLRLCCDGEQCAVLERGDGWVKLVDEANVGDSNLDGLDTTFKLSEAEFNIATKKISLSWPEAVLALTEHQRKALEWANSQAKESGFHFEYNQAKNSIGIYKNFLDAPASLLASLDTGANIAFVKGSEKDIPQAVKELAGKCLDSMIGTAVDKGVEAKLKLAAKSSQESAEVMTKKFDKIIDVSRASVPRESDLAEALRKEGYADGGNLANEILNKYNRLPQGDENKGLFLDESGDLFVRDYLKDENHVVALSALAEEAMADIAERAAARIPAFEIVRNEEKGRVNIKFPAERKHPRFEEMTKELKAHGWKFAPSTKMWYPLKVEGSEEFAKALLAEFSELKGPNVRENVQEKAAENAGANSGEELKEASPKSAPKIYTRLSVDGREVSFDPDFKTSVAARPFDQMDRSGFVILELREGENGYRQSKVADELVELSPRDWKDATLDALRILANSEGQKNGLDRIFYHNEFPELVSRVELVDSKTGEDVKKDLLPEEVLEASDPEKAFLKEQEKKVNGFELLGLPYVKADWSESGEVKGGTVWGFEEADKALAELNERLGQKGGYYKTELKVLYPTEGEDEYGSYAFRFDFGSVESFGTLCDYIRETCSYPKEVFPGLEKAWKSVFAHSVEDNYVKSVDTIVKRTIDRMKPAFEEAKKALSEALKAESKVMSSFLVEASAADAAESGVSAAKKKCAEEFEKILAQLAASTDPVLLGCDVKSLGYESCKAWSDFSSKNALTDLLCEEARLSPPADEFDWPAWRKMMDAMPSVSDFGKLLSAARQESRDAALAATLGPKAENFSEALSAFAKRRPNLSPLEAGKILMKAVRPEELPKVSDWLKDQGCVSEEATAKKFAEWISGKEMEKKTEIKEPKKQPASYDRELF